ncbi:MAG: nucleotidyltransferase domain-containing protein [Chloroflexi bacterium]|nr:nucleotidyltransferase domain-containing protein [Chloroflexota bacterium]
MVDKAVLNLIRNYMEAVREAGIAVSRVVLFGSFARGEDRADSDIDLIVVAPEFDELNVAAVDLLWELRAFTDARIEPIACGEKQWHEDDSIPVIEVARREGVVILLEPVLV